MVPSLFSALTKSAALKYNNYPPPEGHPVCVTYLTERVLMEPVTTIITDIKTLNFTDSVLKENIFHELYYNFIVQKIPD